MPEFQPMVLTDRADTPVDHNFQPASLRPVPTLETEQGVVSERSSFSVLSRDSNGRMRTELKLVVPIVAVETINGIDYPRVVRESFVNCKFNFDVNSSEQERNDVVGLIQSSLLESNVLVHGVVVGAKAVY